MNKTTTCGSSALKDPHGIRAGVLLESPDWYSIEHSIGFGFKASNNVAEYEAVLARMDLTRIVKAKKVRIKSHFRLVVGKSTGEFEATEESMKKYQEAVWKRMTNFDEINPSLEKEDIMEIK